MDRLNEAAQLSGWIPWRVSWPGGQCVVDWCYLGHSRFEHSFFEQTIKRCMQSPFNLLFRHQTSIEALRNVRPGLRPTGFIFHLSRSGSTLVSRMLQGVPANIVISEARPIDSMLRACQNNSVLSSEIRLDWFRLLVNALAQPRRGDERNFFVKFDAWNIFDLPLISKAFPDVPWVFVYRNPIEVLVSQMNLRGAYLVPGVLSPLVIDAAPDSILQMAPEEYCARVLGAICSAALKFSTDGGLLINYVQLPSAVPSLISNFFGISWSAEEVALMESASRSHSKSRSAAFQPDSLRKREQASERMLEASLTWIEPIYEQLEARRLNGKST